MQAVNRLRVLAAVLISAPLCAVPGRAENLKLLVSVQQQDIVAPNPVRAILHFHNSGRQTLWLYRPVQSRPAAGQDGLLPSAAVTRGSGRIYGGSNLAVHLAPTNASDNSKEEASGSGFAIAPDALPFPRLVRLAPGQDYDEKVSIHVGPAHTQTSGDNRPAWGRYRFSVTYSAAYSNAGALARDINADLWQGQVSSNSVTLDLQPSASRGSIAGTVFGSMGRPYSEALVTLSDNNEGALDQMYTDDDGRFSFTHLPMGRYWISVRQDGSARDTSVFRNIDVHQAGSPETAKIMMLPVQADKADRILHKPVLFHIVDSKGRPLAKIRLVILWSTGTVVQNIKSQTEKDGFAAVSLIPGPNYVTLRLQGCKDEDRRADVAPGPGVDGFKFVYECARK